MNHWLVTEAVFVFAYIFALFKLRNIRTTVHPPKPIGRIVEVKEDGAGIQIKFFLDVENFANALRDAGKAFDKAAVSISEFGRALNKEKK